MEAVLFPPSSCIRPREHRLAIPSSELWKPKHKGHFQSPILCYSHLSPSCSAPDAIIYPCCFLFFSLPPLSLSFFFSSFSPPAFSANAKRIASHNSWMISAGLEGEGPSSWWLRVDDMEIFDYPMDSSIVYIVARLSAIVVAVCPWCRRWAWRNIEESQQRRRMFDETFSEDRERLLTVASFLTIAR